MYRAPSGHPRSTSGIDRGQEIVLDKTTGVALLAGARAQAVFERCQRADPTTVLDEDTPHRARNVQGRDPPPAPGRESPADHEDDEERMTRHHGVREQPVEHP